MLNLSFIIYLLKEENKKKKEENKENKNPEETELIEVKDGDTKENEEKK